MDYILNMPQALELFRVVHGGLSGAGRVANKYHGYGKTYWWIGMEASQGSDLMPLLNLSQSDPDMAKLSSSQTYKDLHFIRRETNKLAKYLLKLECT